MRRTSATGAKAETISDSGATTSWVEFRSCHTVFMESESLPTGMAMPSAGQNSSPTARTAAYSAASSPGSPQAAIQLADRRMSPRLATSALSRLVTASATARRAEAGASSSATGVRSPMASASPLWCR